MVETGVLISLVERRQRKLAKTDGPTPDRGPPSDEPKARRPIGLALFVLAVLALGILITVLTGPARINSIRELPVGLRSALYEGTLWEARDVCGTSGAAAGALREHCLGQARFLLSFPECDLACRKVAQTLTLTRHK